MDAPAVAKLLALNVEGDWDTLAEIARPGIAAKIAAVRDGAADTGTLPVDYAARLAGELGDSARGGDTRAAVLRSVGNAPAPKQRNSRSKLFTGDADTIRTRLAIRRSPLKAEHIATWAELEREIQDGTVNEVLNAGDREAVAATLAQLAERDGASITDTLERYERWLEQRWPGACGSYERSKAVARLCAGTRAALGRWLSDHHSGEWTTATAYDDENQVAPAKGAVAHGAGTGLAAAAGALHQYFQGPPELADVALGAASRSISDNYSATFDWAPALAGGAASGCTWEHARSILFAAQDGPLDVELTVRAASTILQIAGNVERVGAFAGRMLATEARRCGPHSAYHAGIQYLITNIAAHLSCTDVLWVCAAFSAAPPGPRRDTHWARPALRYLSGALCSVRPADLAAALEDPELCEYMDELAAASLADSEPPPGTALALLRAHAVTRNDVTVVLDAAERNDDIAKLWARRLSAAVDAHAGSAADRAQLWSAVCTLAPNFAGSTDELVDVAASTLT